MYVSLLIIMCLHWLSLFSVVCWPSSILTRHPPIPNFLFSLSSTLYLISYYVERGTRAFPNRHRREGSLSSFRNLCSGYLGYYVRHISPCSHFYELLTYHPLFPCRYLFRLVHQATRNPSLVVYVLGDSIPFLHLNGNIIMARLRGHLCPSSI